MHVDYLHPDYIILTRKSEAGDDFTRDMRSRGFNKLRLIKSVKFDTHFLRYIISGSVKWYEVDFHKNGKYYYIYIKPVSSLVISSLTNEYLHYDREDKLNELLK